MGYLTTVEYKARCLLPPEFIDDLESLQPGFIQMQLDLESARMDSRLRKRYAVPFAEPFPIVVQAWLAQIVTLNFYLRRGYSPSDESSQVYLQQATTAAAEIKEAADSVDGLFDLPLSTAPYGSAVVAPRIRSYSEQSPFVAADRQRYYGRQEDCGYPWRWGRNE